MRLNPNAFVMWALLGCLGYLFTGNVTGAVTGLAIGLGVSFAVAVLE